MTAVLIFTSHKQTVWLGQKSLEENTREGKEG